MSKFEKLSCNSGEVGGQAFLPIQKVLLAISWEVILDLLAFREVILGLLMMTVFLGTFFVMFVGMGSLFIEKLGAITLSGVSLAWGAIVTVNIYMFGHISGAHINPALTFSLALVGQFPWRQVPVYVIAEVLGSLMASLLLKWLFSGMDAGVMLTLPVGPNPASDLKVGVLELIITFMYALASCCSRADSRASKDLGGVAVGAVVFVIAIIAGKVTGASMNPARSIGPAIALNNFSKIWIYLVSTLIGSILATSLYFFHLRPDRNDGVIKQDSGQMYSFSTEFLPTIVSGTHLKEKSIEIA